MGMEFVKHNKLVTVDKNDRKKYLLRLLKLSSPEHIRIFIGLVALGINSITNLIFPWIMGEALDNFGSSDSSLFLLKSSGIFLFGSISSWVRVYCLGTATDRIASRLKKALFDRLTTIPID